MRFYTQGVAKMKLLVIAHEAGFNGGANRSLFAVIEKLKNDYIYEMIVIVPDEGAFSKKLKEIRNELFKII